jgi:hypothetical protein
LLFKRRGTFCCTNICRLNCVWKCNDAGVLLYRYTRVQPYSGLLYHLHPVFCLHRVHYPSVLPVPNAQSHCSAFMYLMYNSLFCLYQTHHPLFCLYRRHHPSVLPVPNALCHYSIGTTCIVPLFCLYVPHAPSHCYVCTTCTILMFCLYHMHRPMFCYIQSSNSEEVISVKTSFCQKRYRSLYD